MGNTLEQRYALRETIAAGSVGTVWRADDKVTGQSVAVKILRHEVAEQTDVVAAFREEGHVLAELDHPGVVRPRDFVSADGELALVMDLVEGTDLRRLLIGGGPLAPVVAARVLAQVCEALAAVHAAGIVHGDIKPGNILVPDPAGSPGVRLIDFGVAQRIQRPMGVTHATPEYVAPEVVDGAPAIPASDVYAVGIVLYEVLVGRGPFRGGSIDDVLRRHGSCEAVRLAGMPDRLWQLIVRCLQADTRSRPTAGQLGADLRAAIPALTGLTPLPDDPAAVTFRPRPAARRTPTVRSGRLVTPLVLPLPDTAGTPQEAPVTSDGNGFVSLDDLLGRKGSTAADTGQSSPASPDARPSSTLGPGTGQPPPAGGGRVTAAPADPDEPTEVRTASWTVPAPDGSASTDGSAQPLPIWAPSEDRADHEGNRRTPLLLGLAAGLVLLAVLTLGGWMLVGPDGGGRPATVADRQRPSASSSPTRRAQAPDGRSSAAPSRTPSPSPTGQPGSDGAGSDGAGSDGAGSDGAGQGDPGQAGSGGPTIGDPGGGFPGSGGPGIGDPMPTMPGGRGQ